MRIKCFEDERRGHKLLEAYKFKEGVVSPLQSLQRELALKTPRVYPRKTYSRLLTSRTITE